MIKKIIGQYSKTTAWSFTQMIPKNTVVFEVEYMETKLKLMKSLGAHLLSSVMNFARPIFNFI